MEYDMFSKLKKILLRKNNVNGFTLIELMISSLVFLVLIGSVFMVMNGGERSWAVSQAQIDLSAVSRNLLYKITNELSQAGQGTITINGAQDTITFQTPVSFTSGVITWGNQIQYSLSGQDFTRTDVTASTSSVLGGNVTAVQFTQPTTDTVAINLTLSKQSVKGDILTMQIGTAVKLRN